MPKNKNMDILYTEIAKQELLNYCEQSLMNYVFDVFRKFGRIIEKRPMSLQDGG